MNAVTLVGASCRIGERTVLEGIDVAFELGAATAVAGTTGSGKSTLGSLVVGKRLPFEGHMRVDRRVSRLVKLGQRWTAPAATVRASLPVEHRLDAAAARHVTSMLAIDSLAADTPAKGLTRGEVRRLQLAAALMDDPDLVVLDEPTAATDPSTDAALAEAVDWLTGRGRTVMVLTHHARFARDTTRRTVLLDRGRLVADQPTSEVDFLSIQAHNMDRLRAGHRGSSGRDSTEEKAGSRALSSAG